VKGVSKIDNYMGDKKCQASLSKLEWKKNNEQCRVKWEKLQISWSYG